MALRVCLHCKKEGLHKVKKLHRVHVDMDDFLYECPNCKKTWKVNYGKLRKDPNYVGERM